MKSAPHVRKGVLFMNKEELVQEIAKKSNVTQKEAAEVLGALIETIQKQFLKVKSYFSRFWYIRS